MPFIASLFNIFGNTLDFRYSFLSTLYTKRSFFRCCSREWEIDHIQIDPVSMNTKFLFSLVICGLLRCTAFASDAPPLPKECHLTSGVVLHHVSVIRWGQDAVTLKHDGGADPVRYANMADADRAAFEAARDFNAENPPPVVSKPDPEVTFTGQAFVNTTSDGPVKMGGMTIYAFPVSASSAFDETMADELTPMTVKLPKPLATTLTDGDGNFKMTVPGTDPFVLFAMAWRSYGHGPYVYLHRYMWRIKSDDIGSDLILSQRQKLGPVEAALVLDLASE